MPLPTFDEITGHERHEITKDTFRVFRVSVAVLVCCSPSHALL